MNATMGFKKTGKPRKSVLLRYLKCGGKVCYRDLRDAVQAADRYVERIPVLWAPMVPYYCPAHRCWHIGHDRKMSKGMTMDYQRVCIGRQALRKRIHCLSEALGILQISPEPGIPSGAGTGSKPR